MQHPLQLPGGLPLLHKTLILPFLSSSTPIPIPRRPKPSLFSPSSSRPSRRPLKTSTKPPNPNPPTPNLRRLTSRIVDLTRRKRLNQILQEIEMAKKKYGRLNKIVMNAAMEACVRCKNLDSAFRMFDEMSKPESCGVDDVTYAILLKGLGEARRIDEAFQMLESIEQGVAVGRPKLSPQLIYGLLNALLESGDMRRANGLIARYRLVLHKEGSSVVLYNLLMKGYTNTDFPLGAVTVRDEILRQGLKPDKLTYNTLVYACVKSGRIDAAIQMVAEMKEEARKANRHDLLPDAVTYTALVKGLGNEKDLLTVQKIVVEMKSWSDLFIDRTAYTAVIDALLACGSTKGALCIFGEMIKLAGINHNLRPKPHLFLSMMRAFAVRGDFDMVKKLHMHMWSDSAGFISNAAKREADELLMEAAINDNQIDVARHILSSIIVKEEEFTWTSRGGMVAIRIEAVFGFASSTFSPFILPQVSLDDPVEKYMTPFQEANPLPANLELEKVVMRFYKDSVVPLVDDWGNCVGVLDRDDCNKLDAPLSTMLRGPPPCVTSSTSIGRVIDLMLEKKHKMIIIVRSNVVVYETSYSSSSRPLGVFTRERLFRFATAASELRGPCLHRTKDVNIQL